MTTLVGGYTQYEINLLVAAYYTSNIVRKNAVSVAEIFEKFSIEIDNRWLFRSLTYFNEFGLSSAPIFHTDDLIDLKIELTSNGLREAERYIQEDRAILYRRDTDEGSLFIPASDRTVRLDHNSREFAAVTEGIKDLREAVRGLNSDLVDVDDRHRIVASLTAAEALWQAAQLKMIQIKVGVLMAIEDGARILAGTAKAVAAALLIDTLKGLVKARTGLDLDHL